MRGKDLILILGNCHFLCYAPIHPESLYCAFLKLLNKGRIIPNILVGLSVIS